MKIHFGTVVRMAPLDAGGEIVRLDWETGRVEARQRVVPTDPALDDPNPRGSSRGCRGIVARGDDVIAAVYHSLHFYDAALALRRRLSHGLMVGLHEVHLPSADRVFVTSTAIDGVLEFDLNTGALVRAVWPREMRAFQQRWGLVPMPIDKTEDQRTRHLHQEGGRGPSHMHLNAVTLWEGHLLGLDRVHGAILDLDDQRIVLEDPRLRGGHNLVLLDDGRTVVSNDSLGQTVRFYDLRDARFARAIDLRSFPWVRELERTATHGESRLRRAVRRLVGRRLPAIAEPLFVRGLAARGGRIWVGTSPAAIVSLDVERGTLEGAFAYTRDVRVCVHGLALSPDGR